MRPKHTPQSVAAELVRGLRDGSIYLDHLPPKAEQPPWGGGLALAVEVPEDATDEDILARVRELAGLVDDLYRQSGGRGLKVGDVHVLLRMSPRQQEARREALREADKGLRERGFGVQVQTK
jgi:hypothetical protein